MMTALFVILCIIGVLAFFGVMAERVFRERMLFAILSAASFATAVWMAVR